MGYQNVNDGSSSAVYFIVREHGEIEVFQTRVIIPFIIIFTRSVKRFGVHNPVLPQQEPVINYEFLQSFLAIVFGLCHKLALSFKTVLSLTNRTDIVWVVSGNHGVQKSLHIKGVLDFNNMYKAPGLHQQIHIDSRSQIIEDMCQDNRTWRLKVIPHLYPDFLKF